MRLQFFTVAVGLALSLPAAMAHAGSCCGGTGTTTLLLPKFSRAMFDVSVDYERYDGFWRDDGNWSPDPPGSDLNQYRLNAGFAYRLAPNWQAAVLAPYVWNRNTYTGFTRNTDGLGDTTLSLWYEAFDKVMCVWRVESWEDLKPAVYLGAALTVPTGVSPYDNVHDNFDITGRGFYRLDAQLVLDKTVFPWTVTFTAAYGTHLERPVNREYGSYVEPYDKRLGNRASGSLAVGYTLFTDDMSSWTTTLAYNDLWEDQATIDGQPDPTSGFRKRSLGATLAWASSDRDWVARLSVNHAIQQDGWGRNFPTTDILTLGLSHVFR